MRLYFSFLVLFFLLNSSFNFSNEILKPCPSSPNCVSTLAEKKRKKLPPLVYNNSLTTAKEKLKNIIATLPNAKLINESNFRLHFEFTAKIGKFVDDVDFYFDEKNKIIHFRSASRKGWSDMGANKRRMKKIIKLW